MTVAATASLIPGVKLVGPDVDRFRTDDGSLYRSHGIVKALEQYPSLPYGPNGFVPKLPWEPPAANELDTLLGGAADVQPGQWIQIVKLPQAVFDRFEPLRRAARDASREKDLERLRWTAPYFHGMAAALEYAATLSAPGTTVDRPELYFNAPA